MNEIVIITIDSQRPKTEANLQAMTIKINTQRRRKKHERTKIDWPNRLIENGPKPTIIIKHLNGPNCSFVLAISDIGFGQSHFQHWENMLNRFLSVNLYRTKIIVVVVGVFFLLPILFDLFEFIVPLMGCIYHSHGDWMSAVKHKHFAKIDWNHLVEMRLIVSTADGKW